MNIIQELKEQFRDDYNNELDKIEFEFMTEHGVMERAERIVCAMKGKSYTAYLNGDEEDLYDEVWHEAATLSSDVVQQLSKEWRTK